ncbi:MAG: hypothetical protein ACOCRZ_07405 [Halothermotrichaceae bacterium]
MRVKDVALIGILSATLTAGKLALSYLPNIEIVTLLLIVYTVIFGLKRSIMASVIFSTTEVLIYGFSTWLLGYYIIWSLLIIITAFIQKTVKSEYGYAALAAIFGLFYGLFFAVVESFFYGTAYGISYWIRGIPFDIIHCASNFILVILLYKPLYNVLTKYIQNN